MRGAGEDFFDDMPMHIREPPVAAKARRSFADALCVVVGMAVHAQSSVFPFSDFTSVKFDANVSRLASLRWRVTHLGHSSSSSVTPWRASLKRISVFPFVDLISVLSEAGVSWLASSRRRI